MPNIPTQISPWGLPIPEAHALDAFTDYPNAPATHAARRADMHVRTYKRTVANARARICERAEIMPCEMTDGALRLLWASWRKRQWTETLAS